MLRCPDTKEQHNSTRYARDVSFYVGRDKHEQLEKAAREHVAILNRKLSMLSRRDEKLADATKTSATLQAKINTLEVSMAVQEATEQETVAACNDAIKLYRHNVEGLQESEQYLKAKTTNRPICEALG